VNKRQAERFIDRIRQRFDGLLEGRHFALWGLAFKPNTDDVRDAPAFTIINALLGEGATVGAYDPEARETTKRIYGDRISYARTMYDAVINADAFIIATEWNEFRNPRFNELHEKMVRPLIFDGRNVYTLDEMIAEGFEYHSVGRASIVPNLD
jgi:UDPglucose 6-dehydrogenase